MGSGLIIIASFRPSTQCVTAAGNSNQGVHRLRQTSRFRYAEEVTPFYKQIVRPLLAYAVKPGLHVLIRTGWSYKASNGALQERLRANEGQPAARRCSFSICFHYRAGDSEEASSLQ